MSLLHHQFGVVVVDLSSKKLLHCAGHLLTPPHHPCDVVAWVIPQAHAAVAAMTIWSSIGMLHNAIISLQLLLQAINFVLREKIPACIYYKIMRPHKLLFCELKSSLFLFLPPSIFLALPLLSLYIYTTVLSLSSDC